MGTIIKYKPAEMDVLPSPDKYYGVFSKNDSDSPLGFIMFESPGFYSIAMIQSLNRTNKWKSASNCTKCSLASYIMSLLQLNYEVIEFDTKIDLINWLGEYKGGRV
jgi:hypothetical protein